jgi:hypothetical protein
MPQPVADVPTCPRAIARDPRVTVNLEDADECLILEGTATRWRFET